MTNRTTRSSTGLWLAAIISALLLTASVHKQTIEQAIAQTKTIADVQQAIGKTARARMLPYFAEARIEYPPRQITLLAISDTTALELWSGPDTKPTFIRQHAIEFADTTVTDSAPEGVWANGGVYEIRRLLPDHDSRLAIALQYAGEASQIEPKEISLYATETQTAARPGDLVVANEVIEELFMLASDVGKRSVKILIAPHDPRLKPLDGANESAWLSEHYRSISEEFAKYRR